MRFAREVAGLNWMERPFTFRVPVEGRDRVSERAAQIAAQAESTRGERSAAVDVCSGVGYY